MSQAAENVISAENLPFIQISYDVRVTFACYSTGMSNEYHAFLLRLQRDETQNRWRIVVINVDTGEEQRFVGKQALLSFLYSFLNRPPILPTAESPPHSQ